MKRRTGILVVGTGKLAEALLRSMTAAGMRSIRVVGRRKGAATRLAARVAGVIRESDAVVAAGSSRMTILAVPDPAIAELARTWARKRRDWSGRIVLHCAGALGPDVLGPLERRGAAVGVIHPYQALGDPSRGAALLRGAWSRIEGSPAAARAAGGLARRIGLRPIRFGVRGVDPTTYHASASLASNDLIALLALAERTLIAAGARKADARGAVAGIARGVVEQFAARGIAAATGPVIRGDERTVRRHGSALRRIHTDAAAIHALLGLWLLRHASDLPAATRRGVERALRRGPEAARTV